MTTPTMADVARLAGVSKKSISNYFNGYPYFRPETKARIEGAIAELGYRMNVSARNLSSGRTGMIGLALPELDNPYFSAFAQAVVASAQKRGVTVLVEVTGADPAAELDILNGTRGRYVDGLIVAPLGLSAQEVAQTTPLVPVVLTGDRADATRFDLVTVANQQGARVATERLIAAGRRRLVGLGGGETGIIEAATLRTAGFLAAVASHGLNQDHQLLTGPIPWTRAGGAAAIGQLLDQGAQFDGVFGMNDALALGALNELRRRNIPVPVQVGVVGFDNISESAYSNPPLTTIAAGLEWIAQTAVQRLLERLADPDPVGGARHHPPAQQVADFHLVVRASA